MHFKLFMEIVVHFKFLLNEWIAMLTKHSNFHKLETEILRLFSIAVVAVEIGKFLNITQAA